MTEDLTLTFEPLKAREIGLTKACGSDGRKEVSAQNNVGGIASDLNFSRTLLVVVLNAVDLGADRIFLHQPGVKRLQTIRNARRVCDTRV